MNIDVSQKVSAVVCGFDTHMSYIKLMKAVNYLKDKKVKFIATNEDLTYPGSIPGVVLPGAGAVSVTVRAVSGREPMVMGKPHKTAFNYIQEKFDIDPKRTLMIGDRCDTDINFGNRNSITTLLVLTGVHDLSNVEEFKNKNEVLNVPSQYIKSVQDLVI